MEKQNGVNLHFKIEQNDFDRAGEASSQFKSMLRKLGLDAKLIRRAAIAMYEAEINLTIHALGGNIDISITKDRIKMQIIDKGPGIKDLELAMQEGYSTASNAVREMGFGAGMGLPNMKKCSDEFEIESEYGKGTNLTMIFSI